MMVYNIQHVITINMALHVYTTKFNILLNSGQLHLLYTEHYVRVIMVNAVFLCNT